MKTIAILTPAYNRCNLLGRLYASLKSQTDKDFVWVVIDDGSTDRTEAYFASIEKNDDFQIIYHKKENGGKHKALNYGYQFIEAPLTFIVDSDDYLTDNAIETIKKVYDKYKEEKDLCGFSFLRGKPNGGLLSDSGVPENAMKESYVECRINRNIGGDMAEVWYTECLKKYPFPEFDGEKFLGEDVVWIRLSDNYKLRYFNDVIYISDYLAEGLTNNRRKHNIASPKGCVVRAESFLNSKASFKAKVKAMLQYYIYGQFANYSVHELYERSTMKIFFAVMILPAHVLYMKWSAQNGKR